jgi:hypothetical protein
VTPAPGGPWLDVIDPSPPAWSHADAAVSLIPPASPEFASGLRTGGGGAGLGGLGLGGAAFDANFLAATGDRNARACGRSLAKRGILASTQKSSSSVSDAGADAAAAPDHR